MINFSVTSYIAIQKVVFQEISLADANIRAGGDATIDAATKTRIANNLDYALHKAQEWGLETAEGRLERILLLMRPDEIVPLSEVVRQMRTLWEAFEDDTRYFYLYAYPKEKVKRVLMAPAEWHVAITGIPSTRADISSATDLYALGHNLACVFHLMRIMEIGVQQFGKKLRVSLTKKKPDRLADLTWHQILDALNPKLKALPQRTLAGKAKHEKYSAIQSYLFAVKDAWRNPTMHPRRSGYSDLETLDLLNHVRSFMNELASVILPPTAQQAMSRRRPQHVGAKRLP